MSQPKYSNKWVRKFLRLAREACESTNCASRNVGCILVRNKVVVATGMNGPPPGCSNNCSRIECRNVEQTYDPVTLATNSKTEPWYEEETAKIVVPIGFKSLRDIQEGKHGYLTNNPTTLSLLDDYKKGKLICPRRLLGYESGQNLSICSCNHAESNAISFAAREGAKTKGTSCFTYPISPCKTCAGLLVSAGIKEIYTIHKYDFILSRIILKESGINLFLVNSDLLDLDPRDKKIDEEKFVTQYE